MPRLGGSANGWRLRASGEARRIETKRGVAVAQPTAVGIHEQSRPLRPQANNHGTPKR